MDKYTIKDYIEMLTYKRPEGSQAQREFCKRYLEPVFGQPDDFGNYILVVGPDADIAFMSHHDTVHTTDGRQVVDSTGTFIKATSNECLGADCTTGIFIMLNMIFAKVPGIYIVHAAEEVGCKGSRYIVENTPEVVAGCKAAISFDRYGYKSVITHQMGRRTCSEAFSESLSEVLGLGMSSDDTGSYTDSNEYVGLIPECTNVSVGYFKQHTNQESQDVVFLQTLVDACINADWQSLVIQRVPAVYEEPDWSIFDSDGDDAIGLTDSLDDFDLVSIVEENPEAVAAILKSWGYSSDGLWDDICTLHERRHLR